MQYKLAVLLAVLVGACGDGGSDTPSTVSVAKSLGSLQCSGGGTTVAVLQSQLSSAGVQVLAASCGNDGNAYPALCGAPDGAIAIFDLPASQQAAAQALNFVPLSTFPNAAKAACR